MAVLSSKLNEMLNAQLIHELHNSNIYSQIQSYFEDLRLNNLANYFRKQSEEEFEHFNKFKDYLNKRINGKVTIGSVLSPSLDIQNIVDIGDLYLEIEEDTTDKIAEILDTAMQEKSLIDIPFLQEMLAIQVNEENEADEFKKKVSMILNNDTLLLWDANFAD